MKTSINEIRVSWQTLIQITTFGCGVALMFYVSNLLLLIFLTYVLAAGLNPLVEFVIEKLKVNRSVAILGITVIFFGFTGGFLFFTLRSVLDQTLILANNLPEYFAEMVATLGLENQISINEEENVLEQLQGLLGDQNPFSNISSTLFSYTSNVFSGVLTLITLAAITFFQLSDPSKVRTFIISFARPKNQAKAQEIVEQMEFKLGRWLLGQVSLMLAIGVLSYIGFKIIGIEFALPLAIISGVTDVIPVIGPVIAFAPIILVSIATSSVPQTIAVAVYLLVLQQIEGNILVPRIMEKSVGINPIAVIIAIMLGSQILGILGALLAVPITVILGILYSEWQKHRSKVPKN